MKLSKLLPILFVLLIAFNSFSIKAAEVCTSKKIYSKNIIKKEDDILRKGFFKRLYNKVSEKVKKTKQKIVRKFKRHSAKRKAKKNRTKGSLKHRNKNLYNVLIYSSIFLLFSGLISALLYFSIITFNIFLILAIIATVTTIVIALIYFSQRFTVKPNFK